MHIDISKNSLTHRFYIKGEFDSALADFNARLTTFEAGINSKIDSQVSSYLDRNGIWNGKDQDLNWTDAAKTYVNVSTKRGGVSGANCYGIVDTVWINEISKSGLLVGSAATKLAGYFTWSGRESTDGNTAMRIFFEFRKDSITPNSVSSCTCSFATACYVTPLNCTSYNENIRPEVGFYCTDGNRGWTMWQNFSVNPQFFVSKGDRIYVGVVGFAINRFGGNSAWTNDLKK